MLGKCWEQGWEKSSRPDGAVPLSPRMKKQHQHYHDVEALYRAFYQLLLAFLKATFPYLTNEEIEDILQDLFVRIQRRGTTILGEQSLESLKKHAKREAIDFLRKRDAAKRGRKVLSSLDEALERGFDVPTVDPGGLNETLEQADHVISTALPLLSEREAILIRHIRSVAPYEMSVSELASQLNPAERNRFLPVRRSFSQSEADALILMQVSRSRSALWKRLRQIRDILLA